jgi:hypothetical protein
MGDADDSYDFTMLDPFVERLRADVQQGSGQQGSGQQGSGH